jgi:hypothetical protein
MRKFSLHILTALWVFGEHREISQAYIENTANLELFAVHKIFSEYAERIYAYTEKTPRDTKLCISQLIIIQIFLLACARASRAPKDKQIIGIFVLSSLTST